MFFCLKILTAGSDGIPYWVYSVCTSQHLYMLSCFITARRYASAVYDGRVCLSIRLYVCLSHAGIVPKWLNIGSRKQHRTAAQELEFSDSKDLDEIRMGSPPTRAPNVGGVG